MAKESPALKKGPPAPAAPAAEHKIVAAVGMLAVVSTSSPVSLLTKR